MSQSLIKKLRARSERDGGCVVWRGAIMGTGYGAVWDGEAGRVVLTHRVALEQKLGRPIRPGLLALHHCDNRPCINPDHLYEGTYADNVRDMYDRERVDTGRFRDSAVCAPPGLPARLRSLRKDAGVAQTVLAEKIGVRPRCISHHESGRAVPSQPTLVAYAEYYGLTYEDLVDGDTRAPAPPDIGERLRARRVAAGLTQRKVADGIGLDPANLCHHERGRNVPSARVLQAYADFYGVTVNALCAGGAA